MSLIKINNHFFQPLWESFFVVAVTLLLISQQITGATDNNLYIWFIGVFCALVIHQIHMTEYIYEYEEGTQRGVNFFLFFVGLKITLATCSIGMHPVNSLLLIMIMGVTLLYLREAIGTMTFLLVAFLCSLPWKRYFEKIILHEVFWFGIVFIICAIGRNSPSERIFFLASTIPLGIVSWLFWRRTDSLLITMVQTLISTILLALTLTTFSLVVGIVIAWIITIILTACIEGVLFLCTLVMDNIQVYKVDGL